MEHHSHKFDIEEKEAKEYEIVEEIEGDLLEKEIKYSGLPLSHNCEFSIYWPTAGRLKCCIKVEFLLLHQG